MKVGDSASRRMLITEQSVEMFVALSGDQNPIHTDEEFASQSIFGQRIAPGLQVASLISAALANDLPGPGTIYLGQELRFIRPVYIGDKIEVRLQVTSIPRSGRAELQTNCFNQKNEMVIEGSALVKVIEGRS